MNIILKLFASVYSAYMDRMETKIGYRLRFSDIPAAWINSYVRFNMGPSWQKHGIKAGGINHWTIGALTENNISSRYDWNSKQYQSWFGAYLVKFEEERNFTIQDHYNLAVADQLNWLEDLGDPNPYTKMPAEGSVRIGEIQIGPYQGTLYENTAWPSHSDVGSKSRNFNSWKLMTFCAALFNKVNPLLNLKAKSFLPVNIFSEYEPVILKAYIAIIDLDKKTHVVLGGNAVVLLDQQGKVTTDYFPQLKDDILDAFKSLEITKTDKSNN
jgi:hypothetical protein